jgi:hypothetical protein
MKLAVDPTGDMRFSDMVPRNPRIHKPTITAAPIRSHFLKFGDMFFSFE